MTGVVPKIEREPVYGLRPNENGGIWVPQRPRPRRNRKNEPVRAMTRENRYAFPTFLHVKHLLGGCVKGGWVSAVLVVGVRCICRMSRTVLCGLVVVG